MLQPDLEALDRDALARLQLERMRLTLARVLDNPAWARRLGGVQAGDLRSGVCCADRADGKSQR
jgi:hypothetical protein